MLNRLHHNPVAMHSNVLLRAPIGYHCANGNSLRRALDAVPVAEEHDTLVLALSSCVRLDPLTSPGVGVQTLDESERTPTSVAAVVAAHDRLDSLGSLASVVEGNGADVVVQDVRLDDVVEEVGTNRPEVAVDSRSGTTSEGPGVGSVVRKRGVGVLEEGDGDYKNVSETVLIEVYLIGSKKDVPSQWLTQR